MNYMLMIAIIVALMFNSNQVVAQGQTMLKGKVLDVNSNNPLSLDVEIRSKSGVKMKLKSHFQEGTFEQLLNRNEAYTIIFDDDNILKTEFEITITGEGNYYEQEETFKVTSLSSGAKIGTYNIFKANSAEFSDSFNSIKKEIMTMLRVNRAVFAEFLVGDNKSGKDATLIKKRVESLENEISTKWKPFKDRIKFSSGKDASNDLIILVDKVENKMK